MRPNSIAAASDAARQKKQATGNEAYVNCDYICGSVAPVERLWSLAGHVMPDHRSSLKPYSLEALLFLKVNKSFWDVSTVDAAVQALRAERAEAKKQKQKKQKRKKKKRKRKTQHQSQSRN